MKTVKDWWRCVQQRGYVLDAEKGQTMRYRIQCERLLKELREKLPKREGETDANANRRLGRDLAQAIPGITKGTLNKIRFYLLPDETPFVEWFAPICDKVMPSQNMEIRAGELTADYLEAHKATYAIMADKDKARIAEKDMLRLIRRIAPHTSVITRTFRDPDGTRHKERMIRFNPGDADAAEKNIEKEEMRVERSQFGSSMRDYFEMCVEQGWIDPNCKGWPEKVKCDLLMRDVAEFMQAEKGRWLATKIGEWLRENVPSVKRKRAMVNGRQAYWYFFPPMEEFCQEFDKDLRP